MWYLRCKYILRSDKKHTDKAYAEKELNASTHFATAQASTSVWNNKRDQKYECDWQHMFQQS